MPEPVLRRFRPGDEASLNDGFNRVFGLQRTLSEWEWKFPTLAPGRAIAVAADDSGAVVAHYGAAVVRMQLGELACWAGQIVDAFSLAQVRGTRLFSQLYETFVREFGGPDRLALLFGFPGRQHYTMGLKHLQYVTLGEAPCWRRDVGRRWWWPQPSSRIHDGFDADFSDALWRFAAPRYRWATVRDARYLRQRYTGRPGVEYVHMRVSRRGTPCAWAVAVQAGSILKLADLVWDGAEVRSLHALNRALDDTARRLGCTSVQCWLQGDEEAEIAFADLGWRRTESPEDLLFIARSCHPELDLAQVRTQFYLTMGDSDLV
jgi:hypothetical protein